MYDIFNSKYSDIWGEGYDITEKLFVVDAMINRKPNTGNDSADILDPEKRKSFIKLAQKVVKEIESLI